MERSRYSQQSPRTGDRRDPDDLQGGRAGARSIARPARGLCIGRSKPRSTATTLCLPRMSSRRSGSIPSTPSSTGAPRATRRSRRDTFRARKIPKDTMVLASNLSAMFDPLKIEAPESFRTDRPWDDYILWGYGLARMFRRLHQPRRLAGDPQAASHQAGPAAGRWRRRPDRHRRDTVSAAFRAGMGVTQRLLNEAPSACRLLLRFAPRYEQFSIGGEGKALLIDFASGGEVRSAPGR